MAVLLLLFVLVQRALADACPFNCRSTKYKIFCRGTMIKSLPQGRPTTTLLSMKDDMLTTLNANVVIKSGLRNLITLELIKMNINVIQSHTFANTTELVSLTISNNNISDLQPGAFHGLDKVTNLNLSQNILTTLSSGIFVGLSRLRYLDLTRNRISEIRFDIFADLRKSCSSEMINTLASIDLSQNEIWKVDEEAFSGLCSLKSLKIGFSLFTNPVTPSINFNSILSLRRLEIHSSYSYHPLIKISTQSLNSLRNLKIINFPIQKLQNRFLQQSKLLEKMFVVNSAVEELEVHCFQGLESLTELYLYGNLLKHLSAGVFQNLKFLKHLDLSNNNIQTIQENSFVGLRSLTHLNLTQNSITQLRRNTFHDLHFLRELLLYADTNYIPDMPTNIYFKPYWGTRIIMNIEPGAFLGMFSLKSIQLDFSPTPNSTNVTLESLHRLDTFQGPAHFIADNLQIMKGLSFKVSEDLNSYHIDKWFRQLTYLKQSVKLEIHDLNSISELKSLSRFSISNLVVSNCKICIIGNNSFMGFYQLKSLKVRSVSEINIEQGAFSNIQNVNYLELYAERGFQFEPGVFQELGRLKKLSIESAIFNHREEVIVRRIEFKGLKNAKELILRNQNIQNLVAEVFRDLENLEKLDLRSNRITSLDDSAFRSMHKLQTLDLSYNDISFLGEAAFNGLQNIEILNLHRNKGIQNIGSGVFGAICYKNFTVNCANITRLSRYCNTSFVLDKLSRLDLSENSIKFIHQHAFMGCNKLKELILKDNNIQNLDFLYTPELTYLDFSYNGNVYKISNNTFRCTPILAEISFHKTGVKFMDDNTLTHLKNLKRLDFPISNLDCRLQGIWQWLRSQNILYYKHTRNFGLHIDLRLSGLECNNSREFTTPPESKTSSSNELIYFKMYIEPIVFIFIFFSGCFGNGLLLFIVFRHSDMRNKNNACVAHLAISDILSLVLNIPLSYWDVLHVNWDLGNTACKIFITSKELIVALVAFSVVALTYERFLVVSSFNKLKSSHGNCTRPIILIFFVWIYALVTSIPSYFHATVVGRCLLSPPGSNDYVQRLWTFQLLMNCFLPVVSIIFLNIISAYILKKSIREIPGEIRNRSRDESRNSVANVVTVLSLVFTLSSFPNFLLRTMVSWSVWTFEEVFWYSFVTYCLFFFHTIFNPFALFVMGSKYKSHISEYVRKLVGENRRCTSPSEVKKEPLFVCDRQRKTGTEQKDDHQVPNYSDDISSDESARQARQERLQKLQTRFL